MLQSSLLFLCGLLAFSQQPHQAFLLLTLLITAIRVLGNFILTTWGSLVSEYLEPHQRGSFLGGRSRNAGIVGLASMMFSGVVLYLTNKSDMSRWGFCIIFVSAAVARFIAALWMTRLADVPIHSKPGSDFTFYKFIRQFRSSNFVKFVLFVSAMTFATQMASPFFSVYLLRDLHFNYIEYMSVYFVHIIGGLVAFPLWGSHADIAGNAKVLKITSFIIPFIPLCWIFASHPFAFGLIELIGGFMWGGFNLCSVNFVYDAVSPEKRVRCLGYFNLINGMAFFMGSSMGGFLADRLPSISGHSLLGLFLLSAVLRMGAHFMTRRFREVRHYHETIRSVDLFFSVVGLKPINVKNRD